LPKEIGKLQQGSPSAAIPQASSVSSI